VTDRGWFWRLVFLGICSAQKVGGCDWRCVCSRTETRFSLSLFSADLTNSVNLQIWMCVCCKCVAVPHVAVRCSALRNVAVCCSALQCITVHYSRALTRLIAWIFRYGCACVAIVLQCTAACCSVLQCAAVCCSALRIVAVCCSALPCVTVQHWFDA